MLLSFAYLACEVPKLDPAANRAISVACQNPVRFRRNHDSQAEREFDTPHEKAQPVASTRERSEQPERRDAMPALRQPLTERGWIATSGVNPVAAEPKRRAGYCQPELDADDAVVVGDHSG